MKEALRRQYLQAMGITVWERRDPPAGHVMEADAESLGSRETPVIPATQGVAKPAPSPASRSETPSLQTAGHSSMAAEQERDMSPQDYACIAPPADEGPPAWDEAPPWSEIPPWHEAESGENAVAGLDWEALRKRVRHCKACGLRAGCTQTVFGVGNLNADLMVIGEAPGADEDRQGEPFVGRAGQLLNAMLLAIGFKREQVFIANVLKCRPPNNRDPKAEEVLQCEPYLLRQIALVRPRVILSVGRISAQNLLKTEIAVGKLRGRVHDFGGQGIPLVVTYHPAYLLRSPEQKGKAWEDLQLALELLRQPAA